MLLILIGGFSVLSIKEKKMKKLNYKIREQSSSIYMLWGIKKTMLTLMPPQNKDD